MSQINELLERIAKIESLITLDDLTVTYAHEYQPGDPVSANCPFFINELKGGNTHFAAHTLQAIDTHIILNLCVCRYESQVTMSAAQKISYAWRDAVFTMFAKHLRLDGDLDYLQDAYIVKWDLEAKQFGTAFFWALWFDLFVRERFGLTIGQ